MKEAVVKSPKNPGALTPEEFRECLTGKPSFGNRTASVAERRGEGRQSAGGDITPEQFAHILRHGSPIDRSRVRDGVLQEYDPDEPRDLRGDWTDGGSGGPRLTPEQFAHILRHGSPIDRSEQRDGVLQEYSPDQPRDWRGRWTDGGSGGPPPTGSGGSGPIRGTQPDVGIMGDGKSYSNDQKRSASLDLGGQGGRGSIPGKSNDWRTAEVTRQLARETSEIQITSDMYHFTVNHGGAGDFFAGTEWGHPNNASDVNPVVNIFNETTGRGGSITGGVITDLPNTHGIHVYNFIQGAPGGPEGVCNTPSFPSENNPFSDNAGSINLSLQGLQPGKYEVTVGWDTTISSYPLRGSMQTTGGNFSIFTGDGISTNSPTYTSIYKPSHTNPEAGFPNQVDIGNADTKTFTVTIGASGSANVFRYSPVMSIPSGQYRLTSSSATVTLLGVTRLNP
jgi:hypothetical protein